MTAMVDFNDLRVEVERRLSADGWSVALWEEDGWVALLFSHELSGSYSYQFRASAFDRNALETFLGSREFGSVRARPRSLQHGPFIGHLRTMAGAGNWPPHVFDVISRSLGVYELLGEEEANWLEEAGRRRRIRPPVLRFVSTACATVAIAATFTTASDGIPQQPKWVRAATERLIRYENAKPVRIAFISYPNKIAVVLEFSRVVTCGCGGPSDEHVPQGRVIRVSFDRRTHVENSEMRFCEVRGKTPPLGHCLAR